MTPDSNGWNEWSKYVLNELKRLNDSVDKLTQEVGEMKSEFRTEIALLKLKSGLWGLAGGAVPVAIAIATRFI